MPGGYSGEWTQSTSLWPGAYGTGMWFVKFELFRLLPAGETAMPSPCVPYKAPYIPAYHMYIPASQASLRGHPMQGSCQQVSPNQIALSSWFAEFISSVCPALGGREVLTGAVFIASEVKSTTVEWPWNWKVSSSFPASNLSSSSLIRNISGADKRTESP